MKSPIINEVTQPLREAEATWREQHTESLRAYQGAKLQYDARLKRWKRLAEKDEQCDDSPAEPDEPICRRVLLNDTSFEKLHLTLAGNPAGVMVLRDELTGLLASLDREDRVNERQFYLEAWNGDSPYTVDRIGRGSIFVPANCVSLFGGIQPGRLRSYVAGAVRGGVTDDGLIQRLQVLVWPDEPKGRWHNVDRLPDCASQKVVKDVFDRLLELSHEDPLVLRFSEESQALFDQWREELESELRGDELPDCLTSHLAKYRSLMPTLAGLFELVEWAQGSDDNSKISLPNTQRAAAFCDYLRSHAVRVYAAAPQSRIEAAKRLLKRIKDGRLGPGSFSLRDVYRPQWSGLTTAEEAEAACGTLVEYGWLRAVSGEAGRPGRPTKEYEINPQAVVDDER